MPAKKVQNKNLVEQLEDYWRKIAKDIPKRNDADIAAASLKEIDFKDVNQLVAKLKNFSSTLENFVSDISSVPMASSFKKLYGIWKSNDEKKTSIVKMKLNPKPLGEREKLNISLTVNLETGKSNVFLSSKIGLRWYNFTHVSVESIPNLDMDGTLENIRAFTEKYREYKEGAEIIAEQRKVEVEKQKKLAEMASKSIETIVPQMMSQSGYEWDLERECKQYGGGGVSGRYILRIKMKKRRMIEITLNQNNFANKIPEILNVAKQIEQLLEQVPYAVNIVNYGPGTRWIKGTSES